MFISILQLVIYISKACIKNYSPALLWLLMRSQGRRFRRMREQLSSSLWLYLTKLHRASDKCSSLILCFLFGLLFSPLLAVLQNRLMTSRPHFVVTHVICMCLGGLLFLQRVPRLIKPLRLQCHCVYVCIVYGDGVWRFPPLPNGFLGNYAIAIIIYCGHYYLFI